MLNRLEEAHQRFLSSSAAFLASWYWDTVLALVADHANLTNSLGQEKLARLKGEVRSLQAAARSVVDETLGADAIWWHKKPKDQWYAAAPGQLPEWMTAPLERAADRLGEVMRKYGYVEGSSSHYALGRVTFPDDMVAGVNRYDHLKRETERLNRRLYALKRARSRGK
jgi:hypothetical protein